MRRTRRSADPPVTGTAPPGAVPSLPLRTRARRVGAALLVGATVIGTAVTGLATPAAAAPPAADDPYGLSAPVGPAAKPAMLAPTQPEAVPSVLVFSKTGGFRHDSIDEGVTAITQLGAEHGFTVTATEDAGAFTDTNLAQYDAVVWLSTTGDVLNPEQQGAFERYIAAGGGYAGVHAASDTEYEWPWYGELVGAYFASHPEIQQAGIDVAHSDHASTAHLPDRWTRTDEWYNFRDNPRGSVKVLATLDESSYQPRNGAMGDHPIVWCHDFSGGRSWYTGGGHTAGSFAEPDFRTHLLGGIRYAAGVAPEGCTVEVDPTQPPPDSDFEQVTLARGAGVTGEPMAMAVLPDGQVLHTSRDGRVWLTTPSATTTLAGTIRVYNHDEDGLQGVAIDPDFATNRWVYLYYAPPLSTPAGDAPTNGAAADFEAWKGYNQLSRYTLTEAGTIDLDSEQQILQVPADRGICCHAGGEIDFDDAGNLYLSTGDDTNPFESSGYAPIDDRTTRNPAFDARRSAANTNDLRGKVLRITVGADGSYTIPEGNLFAPGTAQTLPEIYVMGLRNPFRFAVDKPTGDIYLGEYGPDAGSADPNRGPGGIVEFNKITEPGNLGWPLCVGDNQPFRDYDFATSASGPAFDCAAPVNDSALNTGLTALPPAQPAWIPYDGGSVPAFGNGSESPMGGPVYHFDPANTSETKFPEYFDGKAFLYEWERQWIKTVDPAVGVASVQPFFDSMQLRRPMNIEFGPDGSLYVLDYGSGYFGGAEDSALYRIDYTQGQRSPQVRLTADPTSGPAPLTVRLDPTGTVDPDGGALTYAWDFTGDGTVDSTEPGPVEFTYTTPGAYTARLEVTNPAGRSAAGSITITVGNTAPTVELRTPVDGGVFSFGDTVPFEVVVTDPEDQAAGGVDCSRVVVEYILGHDTHGHPLSRATGCSGVIQTLADGGHGADANIFGVLNATYTDGGAGEVPALTADDEVVLRQRAQQAEFYTASQGVQVVDQAQAQGGRRVGYIEPGDFIAFDPTNLAGVSGIGYRYSSGGLGGTLEVRAGSPDGPLVQTVNLPPTGGWDNYQELAPAPITDPGGTNALHFVFSGATGAGLFDLDVVRFAGRGVSDNAAPSVTASGTPTSGSVPLEVTFTATGEDPDGDAVSYAWEFGDGGSGEGATATHTYTAAGNYTATVTATDARGASSTATVAITAGADISCPDPNAPVEANDEFLGATLDGCRWDVTRYDPGKLRVVDGVLQLDTVNADIYGATNGPVPNIVTQPAPAGDWTLETSVRGAFTQPYQQGGLIAYGDDGNYVKLNVMRNSDTGVAVELVSETGDVVGTPAPKVDGLTTPYGEYRLRLTKTGDVYSGQYSLDSGESWVALAEQVTNTAVAGKAVGLFALGNQQTAPTTASFDWFRITGGGTEPPACTPTVPEEGYRALFDGTAESAAAWRMSGPGEFVLQDDCSLLTTGGLGMLWYPEEFGAYSLKLDWKLAGDDNSGVFVGFPDPGNDPFVAVNQGYEIQIDATDAPERTTGSIYTFQAADIAARDAALNPPGEWNAYEIRVQGQTITVSLNDVVINEFTSTDPARDLTQGFIGLQNHGNGDDVNFRNVRIAELPDAPAAPTVAATTDPAAPDGNAGWFRTNPTVTLTATPAAGSTEPIAISYRLDGGAWTPYTGPVAVTGDGQRVLEYRAAAGGAESAVGTVTLPVDTTTPLSTSAFADPGPDGWATGSVEVAVEATDATSGVERIEYALDGGPWTPYTGPVTVSGDGQHTMLHRAVDVAGNVEPDKAATIAIDGTRPTLLVSGVANGAVYGDATDVQVSWEATDATSGVASVRGTLDGTRMMSGSLIALHTLSLGTHTLRVVAADEAGNRTTQTVRFATTTSLRDISQLITRFRATNRLSLTATSRLNEQLTLARQAEASGDDLRTLQELERFRALAGDTALVRDGGVRQTLLRDTDAVVAQINGG